MQRINQPILLIIVFYTLFGISTTNAQSDWEYRASVYGWFAGIDGTVGVAVLEEQVDATTADLLKNLEFTGGAHFEARTPVVSLIADVFYMGLGQDVEIQKTIGRTTFTKSGELDLDEWVVEGAIGYRTSKVFELLLAVRYYDIIVNLQSEGSATTKNKNWFDGFVGARYMTDFAERWYVSARTDLGMGGSAFAWFGNAALGYRFSELFSLSLSYRILSVDYEDGSGRDYFKYDTFNHGIGLAADFTF